MSCHDFGKYMKGSFAKTDNSRNQVFSLCIPINLKKKKNYVLVWVFQKVLIYRMFTENGPEKWKYPVSGGPKCLVDARGQRRMTRMVWADRNATVTKITSRYNRGLQKNISERTTYQQPHRVLLLSANNRKLRLQFAQAHQNWTIEDWKKVTWCEEESWFLLWHSDSGVRIWCKQH